MLLTLALLSLSTAQVSAQASAPGDTQGAPSAQEGDDAPSLDVRGPRLDVEMDPFAYMLRGFSVHGGFRYDFWRLSIGAFGLVYPEFIHGAEGIDAYGSGFGFKWDARFGRDGDGFLAGVEAATGRVELRTDDNASVEIQRIFNVGVRVGWEILLPAGLYVVPWVGVGVSLGGEDTTLASNAGPREWEHQLFYVFPTIHIGWRSP